MISTNVMFLDEQFNIKIAILPKLIYYLYVLSIKIPVGFFPPSWTQ